MKLLMLIHRLPFPADRGAKLRAALELRWLASRHEVWCAGLWEHEDASAAAGQEALGNMRPLCREIAALPLRLGVAGVRAAGSLLTGGTASEGFFSSAALERKVLAWADAVHFDAVLAFSSSMAPLALRVPAKRHVLDMVDLDSIKWAECAESGHGWRRHVHRIESRRLARGEREWIAAFDATVLVNAREARRVEPTLRSRVHVIETGHLTNVDGIGPVSALPDDPIVGLVGAMDYGPNIEGARWFADQIWPRIQQARPEAQWWIVGRSPAPCVQQLANIPGTVVTGTVPLVEPYFERMRVHVAPLHVARGVQTKVVAAMAAGRPCVVTPCVAQGIEAVDGQDYLVADTPDSFASAVIGLLENRQRAQEIGERGRAFVARRYDPQVGLGRLESLLLDSHTNRTEAA